MAGDMGDRAGVSVPSTSKRTIVFERGREGNGVIELVVSLLSLAVGLADVVGAGVGAIEWAVFFWVVWHAGRLVWLEILGYPALV